MKVQNDHLIANVENVLVEEVLPGGVVTQKETFSENIQKAINVYSRALEVFIQGALLHDCREVTYWLGGLLYDEERFAEARKAFAIAHQAMERLRGGVKRQETRDLFSEENADLYTHLVHCCLLEGDETAAFKYAVAGKGRAFVDLLSSVPFELINLPAALQKKVDEARHLKAQLDIQQVRLMSEASATEGERTLSRAECTALQKEVVKLRQQENELWEAIRHNYPDYFATQAASPLTLEEAQKLAHVLSATLVEFYRHTAGWVAFVIRPDATLKSVELPITDEQLLGWWSAFKEQLAEGPPSTLPLLQKLYEVVITPLRKCECLPSVDQKHPARLVLAPFSLLHLFPLAALRHERKSLYLGEEYVVSITPSLAVLNRAVYRAGQHKQQERKRLCSVAYPGLRGSNYLFNVLPLAAVIVCQFKVTTRLWGPNATLKAAISHGPGHDVVHYGCHGNFEVDDVEHSGLLLADGWLRVRDIFNRLRLPDTLLAVLSGCVTGQVARRGGDELSGLVQAFMYAGAPGVIASLWSVDDAATRYLFEHFYTYYTAGMSAANALRLAQQELRSQKEYEHPYYWAAFQPIGAVF